MHFALTYMFLENLKLFFGLFYRPRGAMSDAIDRGSLVFGAIAVLIVAFIFQSSINAKIYQAYGVPSFNPTGYNQSLLRRGVSQDLRNNGEMDDAEYEAAVREYRKTLEARQMLPLVGDKGFLLFSFNSSFFTPPISLAVFYVPVMILLLTIFAPVGGFGLVLRRDYGTLLTCTLLAWAAAHLPFAIAGIALAGQGVSPQIYLLLWLASALYFGLLMIFALQTVFGTELKSVLAVICFSWLSMSAGMYIFRFIPPFLFSPFLLFYAYSYFRGEFGAINNSYRQRQNFSRFLNNAAINPRDSDAHVQLGLIHRQRRQIDEALKHFQKAVEIDPEEIDANYELGKMARERGDLPEAIKRFSIVVGQNDKHSVSEIWREIGATYYAANMPAEAREAEEKFVERRPFDPEGLYYLGRILKAHGDDEKANEMFRRCIEAAQAAPAFRRSEQKKWAALAKKVIGS